ncbi:hypothetical protein BOW53_07780 [Solemya pervernicosa gill symbiont]|uniref:DUF4369 domain-containing protein n=2 Tax=Gammaproteobacteria incertae sedis TaxID=118884 RepID=A0A1T2L5Y7_9GAMM|nr:hypothetical protein [Candidatus Reidiella endopervernicosa]OOZ40460.1 hypothetical protein BOW53_07780 [Solemya pervernicosa gill symbiont]QKQ25379.1 hypothetical protein HUE57_03050 [Candidatus Reidiella endopervernicosa]
MLNVLRVACALFISLLITGTAWAEPDPGAFVTRSSGSVNFHTEGTAAAPLPPFAKIFSGTQVSIGADSKLQLVYLQNGRQEFWSGPASLEIGIDASSAKGETASPTIKMLPPYMVDVLTRSQDVISDIQSRQGMIRVRSLMTARKVRKAEANYTTMRAESADDDITPEIYLLTTYDELKVYKRMERPLQEILKRQPNNEAAQRLHDQFMAILEAEQEALQ